MPNPWWKFLMDVPEVSVEMSEELSRQKRPSIVPHWELGQIQVDHSREEAGGFQRDGHSTYGKSSNAEIDPNYGSGEEMRCTFELQRGYPRHSEAHDNLEAGLGASKDLLRRMGWSMVEAAAMNTNPPEIEEIHATVKVPYNKIHTSLGNSCV
nr:hypothetical protein CFP56_06196 [Quercus suber]